MSALPAVFDTLVASLVAVLGSGQVFDGPPAQYTDTRGLSVGATRQDESVDWQAPTSDLAGAGETFTIRCLAWAGSGATVFKPMRDQVAEYLTAVENVLSADRSIGGAVSTAWISGGTWMQEQTGQGALVTCEFRIGCTRY